MREKHREGNLCTLTVSAGHDDNIVAVRKEIKCTIAGLRTMPEMWPRDNAATQCSDLRWHHAMHIRKQYPVNTFAALLIYRLLKLDHAARAQKSSQDARADGE